MKKIIVPRDEEISIDPMTILMSKTDREGKILYVNKKFTEISGYGISELVMKKHNIIRHPDMPKAIFKRMWERLLSGEDNTYYAIKNLAKDGRYYWVLANFRRKFEDSGEIFFFAYQKMLPQRALEKIEPLYESLLQIERAGGLQGLERSEKYFQGYLEDKNLSYDEWLLQVLGVNGKQLKEYFALGKKEEKKKKWFHF